MAARWDRDGKRSDSSSVISLMQRDMNSCFFSFFLGAGKGIRRSFHQKVSPGFPWCRTASFRLVLFRAGLQCIHQVNHVARFDRFGGNHCLAFDHVADHLFQSHLVFVMIFFRFERVFRRPDQALCRFRFLFVDRRASPLFRDFPDFIVEIERLK